MSKKSQKLDTLGNLCLKNRKKQPFLLKTMIFLFEQFAYGEKYRLPGIINGKKLTGTVLGDCNVERIGIQKSFLDEYYFLPCKD